MTRQECEKAIVEKLKEIHAIYHNYYPEGRYLSLNISFVPDGNGNDNGNWDIWSYSANNAYYEGGEDEKWPLNGWGHEDVKDEKYWKCDPEEVVKHE